MGPLSKRADRFVRQVFLKQGVPADPEQKEAVQKMQRLADIRRKVAARRKGY